MPLVIDLSEDRADQILRAFADDLPISPTQNGWTGREILNVAGAAFLAAWSFGPNMDLRPEKFKEFKEGHSEFPELEMQMWNDISAAAIFIGHEIMDPIFRGKFGGLFNPAGIKALVGFDKERGIVVSPVEGFKKKWKGSCDVVTRKINLEEIQHMGLDTISSRAEAYAHELRHRTPRRPIFSGKRREDSINPNDMEMFGPEPEPEIITQAKAANHPTMREYDQLMPPDKWCMLIALCLERHKPIPVPGSGWRIPEVLLLIRALLKVVCGYCTEKDTAKVIQEHINKSVADAEEMLESHSRRS